MIINLFPLKFDEAKSVVLQKTDEENEEQIDTSLIIGQGSPGKSLTLLREGMYEDLDFFFKIAARLGESIPMELSGKLYEHVQEKVGKKTLEPIRDRLVFYFDAFLRVLRSTSEQKPLKITPDYAESISHVVRANISQALLEAISDLRYNVRPQLVADYLFERIDKNVRKQR